MLKRPLTVAVSCGLSLVLLLFSAWAGRAQTGDMTYHGGPVLGAPTVYTIFWLPSNHHFETDAAGDQRYQTLINQFVKDVDGSAYLNVATQYSVGSGGAAVPGGPIPDHVSLGGTWIDTAPYPRAATISDPISTSDLKASVTRALSANGWTTGPNSVYFVYLAGEVNLCTDGGSCTVGGKYPGVGGDHYSFTGADGALLAVNMPDDYSFIRASTVPSDSAAASYIAAHSPNQDPYADYEIMVTAHELVETVTDPIVGIDGVGDVHSAWNAGDVNNTEIADLCLRYPEIQLPLQGHVYSLPAEYSNENHGCVYSDPPLTVHARLAKTQVSHGKKETLRLVVSPLAHVTIVFPPLNGKKSPTWHTGRAGAKGAYTYTWKVKETEERVDLQILVASDDGRGAFHAVSYIAGSA